MLFDLHTDYTIWGYICPKNTNNESLLPTKVNVSVCLYTALKKVCIGHWAYVNQWIDFKQYIHGENTLGQSRLCRQNPQWKI